jgi:iron complex outermembrane receptor protein
VRADVTAFVAIRNLANTDYAERADSAFGADRYFPGEDRAATAGVRAAFR